MKPIIEVKSVHKEYRRGAQNEKYLSLRDQVFKSFKPGGKKETFSALEDINFEVYPGESLAIIGKNGAGKSTLLKILSRITPPTRGEIFLRGRLASLLEVGTGFHPELTGRENVYLNGSILGLRRTEINRQFDAIVDFSGVESFLDTPLKHYSSGMQLRLAFAVAAHLEPEILVIDEVLAVGDSAFQQKCIEKMTEVSQSGRTLLFVSHNLQAIRNLCNKGILLENGKTILHSEVETVIQRYVSDTKLKGAKIDLSKISERRGAQNIIIEMLEFENEQINFGQEIRIKLKFKTIRQDNYKDLDIGVGISDSKQQMIIHMTNRFINKYMDHKSDDVIYTFRTENQLKPGKYSLTLFLRANDEIQDWMSDAIEFNILDGNPYDYSGTENIHGAILPHFEITSTVH